MNRHRSYGRLDDEPLRDGDVAFYGVNARLDPSVLGEGEVAHAVNARFDNGRAETRRGIRIMTWGAKGEQGGDPSAAVPYGAVRRAETFNDPVTGLEWMVVIRAADATYPNGRSYRARPGVTGAPITAPTGTDFDACTDLIQTYNGMVMLRGAELPPLYLENIDEGWKDLPEPSGDAVDKEKIPTATHGIYFGNRLLLVDARTDQQHVDTVWVSDIGGVTSVLQGRELYYQSFKINQGSADRLVGVFKFNDTTLVAAKERSIYVVSNVAGTNDELAQSATLDSITDAYGCLAPRSFVQVGKDLWFLGHRRGICSITQTSTNALQGVDVPVSQAIQPIIDRINWEHARNVVAATHENRVYFAVPLDGATDNNAVLVYSTLTGRWAGYDLSQATKVRDFVRFTYGGGVRLGFLSSDGFICLYEDGSRDHTGNADGELTYRPVESVVRTRGYGGRVLGAKRFIRYSARVHTWATEATVTAFQDGYAESSTVQAMAVDPVKYRRPYGQADWDPTNANDDWSTPHREDYAAAVWDDGLKVTDSDGAGTIAFGVTQAVEVSRRLADRGAFVQLEFASTAGRLYVAGVEVEAIRGSTSDGTRS